MNLSERGWNLTSDALESCSKNINELANKSTNDLEKAALDLDLRGNGLPILPDEASRGQTFKLKGPVVLQVQKVKNVAAPKAVADCSHSPRLLRLQLTDGHLTCSAVELVPIPQLSLSLAPGTKVRLNSKDIQIVKGFVMLRPSDISVLGGRVEKLASKWELTQSLAKHTRQNIEEEEGPPAFVPFGKKIPGDDKAVSSKGKPGRQAKPFDVNKSKQDECSARPRIDASSLASEDSKQTQLPSKDGNVARLIEMGFSYADSIRALQKSRGDPETAIDILTMGSSTVTRESLHSEKGFSRKQQHGKQRRPFSSPTLVEYDVKDVEEFGTTDYSRGGRGSRPISGGGRSRGRRGGSQARGGHAYRHPKQEIAASNSTQLTYNDSSDYYFGTHSASALQPADPKFVDIGSFPTAYYNSHRTGRIDSRGSEKQRRGKWQDCDHPSQDLASAVEGLSLNKVPASHSLHSSSDRSSKAGKFPGQPKPSAALAEAIQMHRKSSN